MGNAKLMRHFRKSLGRAQAADSRTADTDDVCQIIAGNFFDGFEKYDTALRNNGQPIFQLIKKCQVFGNGWLVALPPIGEIHIVTGATAPQPNQPEILKMKKMILFAAIFGLTATFTVKADDAKDNWDSLCAKCHGPDGKGDTKMGAKLGCKDFTDAKVQADIKDDAAFKALKEGLKSDDDKTLMKSFGDQLSDDQIKALVAYVHTLKK